MLMEKSFTSFCVALAVVFAAGAVVVGRGELTVARFLGTSFLACGAFAYVVLAINCSRKVPDVT